MSAEADRCSSPCTGCATTHGSIEAYTRTHGLTEAEIAALPR